MAFINNYGLVPPIQSPAIVGTASFMGPVGPTFLPPAVVSPVFPPIPVPPLVPYAQDILGFQGPPYETCRPLYCNWPYDHFNNWECGAGGNWNADWGCQDNWSNWPNCPNFRMNCCRREKCGYESYKRNGCNECRIGRGGGRGEGRGEGRGGGRGGRGNGSSGDQDNNNGRRNSGRKNRDESTFSNKPKESCSCDECRDKRSKKSSTSQGTYKKVVRRDDQERREIREIRVSERTSEREKSKKVTKWDTLDSYERCECATCKGKK